MWGAGPDPCSFPGSPVRACVKNLLGIADTEKSGFKKWSYLAYHYSCGIQKQPKYCPLTKCKMRLSLLQDSLLPALQLSDIGLFHVLLSQPLVQRKVGDLTDFVHGNMTRDGRANAADGWILMVRSLTLQSCFPVSQGIGYICDCVVLDSSSWSDFPVMEGYIILTCALKHYSWQSAMMVNINHIIIESFLL